MLYKGSLLVFVGLIGWACLGARGPAAATTKLPEGGTPVDSVVGGTVLNNPVILPLPIKVCFPLGWMQEMSLRSAIDEFNRVVGCDVYEAEARPVPTYKCPGISITFGTCSGLIRSIACAQRGLKQIVIVVPEDPTDTYLTLLHELGHMAGLNHDLNADVKAEQVSVMAINLVDHKGLARASKGLALPTLEERDAMAIKQRYCPKVAP